VTEQSLCHAHETARRALRSVMQFSIEGECGLRERQAAAACRQVTAAASMPRCLVSSTARPRFTWVAFFRRRRWHEPCSIHRQIR